MVTSRTCRSPNVDRRGSTWVLVLVAIVFVAVMAGATWYFLKPSGKSDGEAPIVSLVAYKPFDHVVLEQGEIESSNSEEVKCAVKSRNSGGTEIVWVIEEGSVVKQDDLLVRLDSSLLERELDQQKIVCNTSAALVEQARNALEAAEIALKEYKEGIYEQERMLILNEIFVASENLERTNQSIASTTRLAAKGLSDELQLQADQFAVENARNQLDLANKKLKVLDQFTSQKMIKTLQSDIKTAAAKLDAEQKSHDLEVKTRDQLQLQVDACTIRAPRDGQVVHANRYSSRGSAEFVVEQGAKVGEGKTIIRIPDPAQMQVVAKINEASVPMVRVGMPVSIRIDALRDSKLQGEVTHVNKYAEPSSWSSGQVKQYRTLIKIIDPPSIIRSGMTAEVQIYVESRPEALQIPVQAVCEHKGKMFCLVQKGEDYETRMIDIGASNNEAVTIESDNLKVGDVVVMNPRGYPDHLQLPDLPDPPKVQVAAVENRKRPQGRNRSEERGGSSQSGSGRGQMFARYDSDGDGKLSGSEMSSLPQGLRGWLASADTDGDGAVDRSEMAAAISQARRNGAGGPAQRGPVGGGE